MDVAAAPARAAARADSHRLRHPSFWPAVLVLAVAVAGFLALGLGEAWSDGPTFDEPVYISAGLAAVLHHDLTFNAEHPPVPKVLAALPVLLARPVIPGNGHWSGNDERSYSARFIRAQQSAGTMRRVMFAARLVPLAETAAVAFAIFGLGAELFGTVAGMFGGLLWLSSPLVLGIGHLDGTDVPFSLTVVLASWALARWLRLRSRRAFGWLGLALAGAALSEASGLLVVAAGLAVVTIATLREPGSPRSRARAVIARSGLVGLVVLAATWVSYAVLDPALLSHPGLLPAPYLDGISYLRSNETVPAPGYLAGVSYLGGHWWFWPLSLVIKLPAATLILLLAGIAGLLATPREARRRAVAAIGPPAVVLTGFTLAMPRDIGVRYLLPVLALWAAGAGALVPAAAALRPAGRRLLVCAASVLLVAGAVTTAASFPDSLSWTAPPFRPGYANATDSNIDWGQGLYALTSWAEGRRVWVAYFGPRGLAPDPVPGGLSLLGAPAARVSGWVAVSASALTSADRTQLAWLWRYCPVRVLDGSVLIYRFPRPPVPMPGNGRPPPPCPGQWSHATPTAR